MQTVSRLLDNWRVLVLLGVLAALIIPICDATGTFHHELAAPIVRPLAVLSPLTSLTAFIIARVLWRRDREARARATR